MSGELRRLCRQGGPKDGLCILRFVGQQGSQSGSFIYSSLLQSIANVKALSQGKLVHAHMIRTGFHPDISVGNKLVTMYAKCGSLADGRRVLDEMPDRNVVSWTAMITAYGRHGFDEEALTMFYQMQQTGVQPNQFTFASVLPVCARLGALDHGKRIHQDIIRSGFQRDAFVDVALVDMYIKCGQVKAARHVLDKMPERNVVPWTGMIAGYAQTGYVSEALKFFEKLPERDTVSWNTMIAGYAQNGYLDDALKLFHKMPEANVVSWTVMIAGCAQNGYSIEAWELFEQMQLTDVKPDPVTLTSVLPACASLGSLEIGKKVHEDAIRSGHHSNIFVESALVDMYVKCGSTNDARQVFDKMSVRNAVSVNAMIAGYAQDGQVDEASRLFQEMVERDVVSWSAMIAGYSQNGHVDEALKLFQKMPERDVVAWNAMIALYARSGHIDNACRLFQKMPKQNVISWNTMIAGYAQNGHVDESLELFQKMPEQDPVSWNAMIAAYAHDRYFNEAFKLFQQMQSNVVKPNSATFASILSACANLAALENGKEVHGDIIRSEFQYDLSVGGALVDMYAKCGNICDARKVFDKLPKQNVISWTAMIVGYAMHGLGKEALQLFKQMQLSGIRPDHVTFIGVLAACCHAGLMDDGRQYFDCMSRDYHITPAVEHYCCMVDLFGRAGCLEEAQDFINKMPIKPNAAIWGSLLGACQVHANIELGECVAHHLFGLDPNNAAHYVLLSNMYAAAGRWDDVERVRNLMKERRVEKRPGCSWIEVNKKVYTFAVGDRSQPHMHQIYAKLERLAGQMKEAGYVPNTDFVLHDVEDEQKEYIVCHHSEKLAIAFGLIHLSPREPIRIVKNLRVCGDCHSATKFISKIVAREIIVRDANRFHHFKGGWCSCRDYW